MKGKRRTSIEVAAFSFATTGEIDLIGQVYLIGLTHWVNQKIAVGDNSYHKWLSPKDDRLPATWSLELPEK